jgi:hypothetical protein
LGLRCAQQGLNPDIAAKIAVAHSLSCTVLNRSEREAAVD